MGALVIGFVTGPVCYCSAVWVKKLLGYDDSLDAFGIHGVRRGGRRLPDRDLRDGRGEPTSKSANLWLQFADVAWTFGWSAVMTFLILLVCRIVTGVRVSPEAEVDGLDFHLHGEALEA